MFTLFFFSGLALGGVWGVREGARRPLAVSNTRLRINSVLNSVTRRGTFIGNSAGVMGKFVSMQIYFRPVGTELFIALLYNGVNSSIDAMRGKHDTMGSMAAGAVTGAIFKSTGLPWLFSTNIFSYFYTFLAGIKPAIAAATVISGMAGIWSYVKKSV